MSEWWKVKDPDDVDVSDDGETLDVLFKTHYTGDCYVEIPIDFVKKALGIDWQPIETAPKIDEEKILAVWLGSVEMASWCESVQNWQEWPNGDFPCCETEITHWMPLPEPPKGK